MRDWNVLCYSVMNPKNREQCRTHITYQLSVSFIKEWNVQERDRGQDTYIERNIMSQELHLEKRKEVGMAECVSSCLVTSDSLGPCEL